MPRWNEPGIRLRAGRPSRRADKHPQPRLQSARSPGVAQELAPFVEVHSEQALRRQGAHQPKAQLFVSRRLREGSEQSIPNDGDAAEILVETVLVPGVVL